MKPKVWIFEPQPDITAYELALCLKIQFLSQKRWAEQKDIEEEINKLPDGARRHLVLYDEVSNRS